MRHEHILLKVRIIERKYLYHGERNIMQSSLVNFQKIHSKTIKKVNTNTVGISEDLYLLLLGLVRRIILVGGCFRTFFARYVCT